MTIVEFIQAAQKLLRAFVAFGHNVVAFMTTPIASILGDTSVLGWIVKRISLADGESYLFNESLSLLDLSLTFIGVFMAYSLLKWAIGIVTGS